MSDECRLYAPNLLCVCINQAQSGDYEGLIWHQYEDRPVEYKNTMDLIRKMDYLYDIWDFPQESTSGRFFGKKTVAVQKKRGTDLNMDTERIQDKKGDKGTFIVHVKYRQNSTWQGEVIWTEHKKKQFFRSALELLKLIDSALDEDKDAEEGQE